MFEFIFSDKIILPVSYIVIGIIIYSIIMKLINKIIKHKKIDKKQTTVISLINNILKYIIIIVVILSILKVYGVDTSGIIASIGVIGVLIGLALQDILVDFLAGLAIIFDNKYTIGDWILVDGFVGEVVGFGLLSTKIKSISNDVKIISNSSMKEIINYSINHYNLFITLDVDYSTDIDNLEECLSSIKDDVIKLGVKDYNLLGICEYSSSSIRYKVSLECKYENHYGIEREYLKLINKCFKKYKISIPFNKLDVNIRGKYE